MNDLRLFDWNQKEINSKGQYVLYWMQINRRFEYNFALEHAVEKANELKKPLLIFEALKCTYPWACDRFHFFILQGMKENKQTASENDWNYYCFVEKEPNEGSGLIKQLAEKSCLIVTDDFPVFVIREHNEKVGPKLKVPFTSVDANGIIPMKLSKKAPYSAYLFRKLMQKNFVKQFDQAPARNPMKSLKFDKKLNIEKIAGTWKDSSNDLSDIKKLVSSIPVDHSVKPVQIEGTRKDGLQILKKFLSKGLAKYSEFRNDPDRENTSGLSPYLHFGKISAHEVVEAVLKKQPERWSMRRIQYNNGSREGFFNGDSSIDAFLDQIITWRETGYHFCHFEENYDEYKSLPDWAKETLKKHKKDKREHIYSLKEFENADTHDELWNAAQNQLVREGTIHNYLRMLWGKKILEWTPDAETALEYLIELNNKYGIDGRNPNSYSGIFWILGRFDRPWGPEREIFGKVRYMSSENTARKVKVKNYLKKFAAPASQE